MWSVYIFCQNFGQQFVSLLVHCFIVKGILSVQMSKMISDLSDPKTERSSYSEIQTQMIGEPEHKTLRSFTNAVNERNL